MGRRSERIRADVLRCLYVRLRNETSSTGPSLHAPISRQMRRQMVKGESEQNIITNLKNLIFFQKKSHLNGNY